MPTQQNTINLIRNKANEFPQLDSIETSLRRTGYIGLIIFLSLSVILGSVYMLFYFENQNQQKEKLTLIGRINTQKNKEAILLAIKDRTKLVQKAMGSQKPWTKTLDMVSTFVTAPFLSTIAVDEQNKVILSVKSNSLNDLLIMIHSIIALAGENQLKNPRLVSFQIGKNNMIDVSVSFIAQF